MHKRVKCTDAVKGFPTLTRAPQLCYALSCTLRVQKTSMRHILVMKTAASSSNTSFNSSRIVCAASVGRV